MAKQVRETSAGQSISAYIVLRADGTEVAKVHAYFADSGGVWVDVYSTGPDDNPEPHGITQGRAHGYGYDKFTAALSGLRIDGHVMGDHCGEQLEPPKGHKLFPENYQAPKGYRRANWISAERAVSDYGLPEGGPGGWRSCYKLPGLGYLEDIGYRVIRAI